MGIDGGATKTLACLADQNGRPLGLGRGGPSNYHWIGEKAARQEIATATRRAFDQAGLTPRSVAVAWLGLAGLDVPDDYEIMQLSIEGLNLAEQLLMDNDMVIALAGALAGAPGAVINSGTGAIAMGCNHRGRRVRADGWGHVLGDEGSGYDIGHQAAVAVMRAHDGRGPRTSLTNKLIAHLGLKDVDDLVQKVYAEDVSPNYIAALVPLVTEAAEEEQDEVARHILQQAGQDLATTTLTVLRRLDLIETEVSVATVGGVFRSSRPVREAFEAALRTAAPRAKIIEPLFQPLTGAVSLALAELGLSVSHSTLAAIDETIVKSLSEPADPATIAVEK